VLLLAGLLMLCACASQRAANNMPPPLNSSKPELQVADIDVLAVTPAMEEFLERYVVKYAIPVRRASALPSASFRFHLAVDTLA
jgi:hypothetical protein